MSALHLARLPIALDRLARWAAERDHGWTGRGQAQVAGFDEGRALHHLLSESFGKGRLQPFRLMVAPRQASAQLYAYCDAEAAALTEEAHAIALPEALEVLSLAGLATKPMPAEWRPGRRLGFEVRVRPTVRLLRPLAHPAGTAFARGAEVDAFLARAVRAAPDGPAEPPALGREEAYADWLAERLAGAAELLPGVRLVRFARSWVARGGRSPEGPDAVLQGDLRVADPERFQAALARGVGRHRAYGFGMLMLRGASGR